MATSTDVFANIKRKTGVSYSVLTPNMKRLDLAIIAVGNDESQVSLYWIYAFTKLDFL